MRGTDVATPPSGAAPDGPDGPDGPDVLDGPDGPEESGTFGLPTATAPVIGSVIGTGVFAVPSGAPFTDSANAILGGRRAGNAVAVAAVVSEPGCLIGWTPVVAEMPKAAAQLYWLLTRERETRSAHLVRHCGVSALALVFSFRALAGSGYQAASYGVLCLVLGVPVAVWLEVGRHEHGETPVVRVDDVRVPA